MEVALPAVLPPVVLEVALMLSVVAIAVAGWCAASCCLVADVLLVGVLLPAILVVEVLQVLVVFQVPDVLLHPLHGGLDDENAPARTLGAPPQAVAAQATTAKEDVGANWKTWTPNARHSVRRRGQVGPGQHVAAIASPLTSCEVHPRMVPCGQLCARFEPRWLRPDPPNRRLPVGQKIIGGWGSESFMVLPRTGKSCSVFRVRVVRDVRAKLCTSHPLYLALAPDPCPAPAPAPPPPPPGPRGGHRAMARYPSRDPDTPPWPRYPPVAPVPPRKIFPPAAHESSTGPSMSPSRVLPRGDRKPLPGTVPQPYRGPFRKPTGDRSANLPGTAPQTYRGPFRKPTGDRPEIVDFSGSGRPRAARKPLKKCGGRSPSPFRRVSRPPGAAQTPKIDDFRSVEKSYLKNLGAALRSQDGPRG